MFKRILLVCMLVLFLVSCSQSGIGSDDLNESPNLPESSALSSLNRKILYKVEGTFHVKDHMAFTQAIKAMLHEDEWIDFEQLSSYRSSLVLRIKTERLDAFLVTVQGSHTFTSYAKTATDISLSYSDKALQIEALLASRARLVSLYEEASFSETLVLNQEIAKLDVSLAKLQGELNVYDSLVDYSEVILTIHKTYVSAPQNFGEEAKDAFYDGIHAIVFIFRNGTLLLIRILPVGILAFGGAFGVNKWVKYRKRQKNRPSKEK